MRRQRGRQLGSRMELLEARVLLTANVVVTREPILSVGGGGTLQLGGAGFADGWLIGPITTGTSVFSGVTIAATGSSIGPDTGSITVTLSTPKAGVVELYSWRAYTPLATASTSDGQATFAAASLPVGANWYHAVFVDGASGARLQSTMVYVTVLPYVLTITPTDSSIGPDTGSVAVSLNIASAGVVELYDSGSATPVATASTSDGQAAFAAASLPAGAWKFYAVFVDGANGRRTQSQTVGVTVRAATTMTMEASNGGVGTQRVPPTMGVWLCDPASGAKLSVGSHTLRGPAIPEETTTLKAWIPGDGWGAGNGSSLTCGGVGGSGNWGEGTVRFYEGDVLLGEADLADAYASFRPSHLSAGLHVIRAVFDGNWRYGPSSQECTVTIEGQATTTTIATDKPSVVQGDWVRIEAKTRAKLPDTAEMTGKVTYYEGKVVLAVVDVGNCGYAVLKLAPGLHKIQAVYSGDANFPGSRSGVTELLVIADPSTADTGATSAGADDAATPETVNVLATPAMADLGASTRRMAGTRVELVTVEAPRLPKNRVPVFVPPYWGGGIPGYDKASEQGDQDSGRKPVDEGAEGERGARGDEKRGDEVMVAR